MKNPERQYLDSSQAEESPGAVALRATGLHKTYGPETARIHALRGTNLELDTGTLTAIMGPSGSGKSTLLRCLAGIDVPSEGSVHIGTVPLTDLDEVERAKLRRARMGFVFQDNNLLMSLTARENVELVAWLNRVKPDAHRVTDLFRQFGIENRMNLTPSHLSGGERQKVAAIRSIAFDPEVVFADEPTGNLDSKSSRELMMLFRNLVDERRTVLVVTHDPLVAGFCDVILTLIDGVVEDRIEAPDFEVALKVAHGLANRK